MEKAAFNKKTLFTSKLDLNLRKKLVKCYIWSMALYGAETWTLRAADQKYLESSEMWCWRRMEKTSWTDHVRDEEVLLRVNEQRNTLREIRKRKANWVGHILRRNWLLKQVIEGKIKGEMEVTRRRGRRSKKLLDDLKDKRGYSHLKEEALDRSMWRNRLRGGFGPVVRQNTEWMNEWYMGISADIHWGSSYWNFLRCNEKTPYLYFSPGTSWVVKSGSTKLWHILEERDVL